VNINLSPNVTTIMTGHRNIRSYWHRLKIIGSPECPRKHGIQTVDHLTFQCNRLKYERETLKTSVLKEGSWPAGKSELTNRNLKQFIRYINSIHFVKINHPNGRSQWPRGLRRWSSAAHLLRSWVRISPGAWMFVCCECCVLSGRGLCDGLITRLEESYRLWCVVVCDQETSKTRRLKPATGLWKIQTQWVVTTGK
jgi:hypothetical protein